MDRASIYFVKNQNDPKTFDYDEQVPPLPLPDLHDTLQHYYENLKLFGSDEQLENSRKIISKFEKGEGAKLQTLIKQRATKTKNWLEEWWNKYAYLMVRTPINPYACMTMPLPLSNYGLLDTPEYLAKNLALILYYTIEFWNLLHNAKIKPLSSDNGKVKYSSALYRHFFSTTRVPGLEYDHIDSYFRTATEGPTPTYIILTGKGRIFKVNCLHTDGTILEPQELLIFLQRVLSVLDCEPMGDCVPVLSNDDRTAWAKNHQHLKELSAHNEETLKVVERACFIVVLDQHEPNDYTEVSQQSINGDYHSKWVDKSSTIVAFKSGKFACYGEHSAYDGTISVSYANYILISMVENMEPDWNKTENMKIIPLEECIFDLDEILRKEIRRLLEECESRRFDVLITYDVFSEYGRDFMKSCKLHPDSFVQVIMQLAYTRLHKDIVSCYETALMRQFYNGRTETLRSCTNEVYNFIKTATNLKSTKEEIARTFRKAVLHHKFMMDEARKGRGIDRHLFGLWCMAYDLGMDTPELFEDPLYAKSGGGGNFVLSTSTLGYTQTVGSVAPMVLDGYGVFYTIPKDIIFIQSTAYSGSSKTSAYKFNEHFKQSFQWIKSILDEVPSSKL